MRVYSTSHVRERYCERILNKSFEFTPELDVIIRNDFFTAKENKSWVNNIFAVYYHYKRYNSCNIRIFENNKVTWVLKFDTEKQRNMLLTCWLRPSKDYVYGSNFNSVQLGISKDAALLAIKEMKKLYKS